MRIEKINSTLPKLKKPLQPLKHKQADLLQKCNEVRHKNRKELSVRDIPLVGAAVGLFTPIPLGFLIGYGVGKLIERGVNVFKQK